ncbi:MAG: hypothetical protein Q9195_001330 [Heterodermia aff. obscurata]
MAVATAIGPSPPRSIESEKIEQKLRMWHKFSFKNWLGRDGPVQCSGPELKDYPQQTNRPGLLGRRLSRKVVPGLPRPATFRRQNSERRERLAPVEPSIVERRAVSVERRRALSARPASPPAASIPKLSAPEVRHLDDGYSTITRRDTCPDISLHDTIENQTPISPPPPPPPPPPPLDPYTRNDEPGPSEASGDENVNEEIKEELEKRWILNLSMHFRDHSPREKFFLTYAEESDRWRRVTVSCDYRNAPTESLEKDLQALQFQRDKSARIYESIRMSLPDIQFFDTVTNLKLETRDDRLHVHVTEDVNEIIPYPQIHAVQHLDRDRYTRFKESDLNFEAHMSGFVYKVRVKDKMWIKKEIPGPDSVDEFLYEINALAELTDAESVIRFQGLVVNEDETHIKGLLIEFAEQGALVDILFDHKGRLPWARRERWAKEIVQGLAEIHEAGFVQGDFTLSNIVIDEKDEAKIIDINRRGCPVGWEPPEISKLIESGQRISMYIGVKSDLFQLGMVLWALATEEDEPERKTEPLELQAERDNVPQYFCELTACCLSTQPRERLTASQLLKCFPELMSKSFEQLPMGQDALVGISGGQDVIATSRKSYDLGSDVDSIEDEYVSRERCSSRRGSIEMPFDGPGSYMVSRRGRTPPLNMSHLSLSDRPRSVSVEQTDNGEPNIIPVSPSHRNTQWDQFDFNGTPYLVQRDSLRLDDIGGYPTTAATRIGREFTHVDSGLADMDLAGIGGHDALLDDLSEKVNGTSHGTADEMGVEDDDNDGITDDMNKALGA